MTIFDDQELQRQGCDLRRTVAGYVATPSGSSALPPQPPDIACDKAPGLSLTGYGTSECALSIR